MVALGMIWIPDPMSMWVERQFISTTLPLAPPTSRVSPRRNGCSKSSSNPDTTLPTAFCSASPMTMDPTPSAANRPPTSRPQTNDATIAAPATTRISRARSTKIVGSRSRQVPSTAFPNSTAFSPARAVATAITPTIGGDGAYAVVVRGQLGRLGEEDQEGGERQQDDTKPVHGPGKRVALPLEAEVQLGEEDDGERQADDEGERPSEPRLRRDVIHRRPPAAAARRDVRWHRWSGCPRPPGRTTRRAGP